MVAALLAVALTADPGALQQAQDLYDQLKYPEAARAVAQVRAQSELAHGDLVQALWLEGLCAVSMNKPDDARAPWRELAFLEPGYSPQGDLPPKLLTPWYEARGWAASQKALGFDGKVDKDNLVLTVQADPLKVVNGVRVHLKKGAEVGDVVRPALPQTVALSGATEWWAELVGSKGEVLANLGTEAKPIVVVAPAVGVNEPPPEPKYVPTEHNPRLLPLVFGGVAVVAAGVGIGAGLMSVDAKAKYDNAGRLNDGTVYTLTQRQAASLRSNHDTFAVTANICFGLAIAAAAVAVFYFVYGPKEIW